MSERDYRLFLQDILDSIVKIEKYTEDIDFKEFCDNDMVIDAVIRNFEIIGEASTNNTMAENESHEKYSHS